MNFKPMLASQADLDKLVYPIFASPKLDGIRASVVDGKLLSRTLKTIPSALAYRTLSQAALNGLDGELIVGSPTAHDCYRNTVSHVMADDKDFSFAYYVFDLWNLEERFNERRIKLMHKMQEIQNIAPCVELVKHTLIKSRDELDTYEAECCEAGYEGVMLSDPNKLYKFGRATAKGGELLKVKRFEDSEAEIIGVQEEMHNANDATTNELGRTKRSSAKAGKVGKGTMGALLVRDIRTGVEFSIGTGFNADQRKQKWEIGSIHKYKYFPVGVKDAPRHPVYLGPRSKLDL
jgi:DNA ligase-1